MSPRSDVQFYMPFELLVGARTHAGYPVTLVESPAGEGEALSLLQVDDDLQAVLQAVELGSRDEDLLVELGTFLFNELFAGDLDGIYHTSLGIARSQGKRLRIRLRITPPELAALPWEYLYDLREDAFLAISPDTALVRHMPVRLPVRPTAVHPPLRVLLVISNPQDAQPLDVEQEKSLILDALGEGIEQGRVQLEILERAVVADIGQAMRRFQPHVFHFVGHGAFYDDTSHIVLEHEDGLANLVDDRTFREFFAGQRETRLAILNACQTATVSSSQAFVGLAPRLLQRQLSAVVAMQHPVPDRASLLLTREFYRSLALGFPVDAAVSEARKGIFVELGADEPAWGAPVLFLRAKDGRLFHIEEAETQELKIPPPPEPARPPETAGFVGRDSELAYYAEKLESTHTAVIAGMAGVGKTSLAVKLTEWVADDRDKIFWHSFREGEGVDATIWSLAGFLAWHGREDLWRLLQGAHLTGGKPPPVETLLDYALQLVRASGFLLCFDDFQHVDDDPALGHFVERLRTALLAGEVSLIVTSRRVPDFATLVQWSPLEGLTNEDARRLLMTRDVHLEPQQSDQLYQLTAGNAQFLTLAIDILKEARDPDQLIARLAESDDVEHYLLQEVDEALTGQERAVMTAVATLLGYTGTRDAIETILNAGNVWRTLRRLSERHLLVVQDGAAGREYRQHDIVRAFYYEMASVRQRRRLHQRAGHYYQTGEPDMLRAALHLERAGEYERAARLATQDVQSLISQGQARALLSLLQRFGAGQLEPEPWAEINLARGRIYTLLNDKQGARDSYALASEQAARLPDLPANRVLTARVCHGMGELLEVESPEEALDWLERGLRALGGEDSQVQAALQIRMSYIHYVLGNYDDARRAVERGMRHLPQGTSQLRVEALLQLGSVLSATGNNRLALERTEEALARSQQLHDDFYALRSLINLGIDRFSIGQWQEANSDFQQALVLADRVGDERMRAFLELNLGGASIYLGENEAALDHLLQSLDMTRRQSDNLLEIYVQTNLAEVYFRFASWDAAEEALSRAESLAIELDARHNLPKIYRVWAELDLSGGRLPEALEHARQSVDIAETVGEPLEQGMGLRTLGQVLAACDQLGIARASFEQSLSLVEKDPYETARTRMRFGLVLTADGSGIQGEKLLEQARVAFQELGAEYDLAELDELVGV